MAEVKYFKFGVQLSSEYYATRSSAGTEKQCCRVGQLWQKYNWKMILCTKGYRSQTT